MAYNKPPLGSLLNFGHPLSKGIVGAWLFNEGSGNRVRDYSGNGYTGVLTGDNVKFISNEIYFGGTDDYITYGSIFDSLTAQLTLFTIMSCSQFATGYPTIISKWSGGVGNNQLKLAIENATGKPYIDVGSTTGTGDNYRVANSGIIVNTTYSICGVYSPTELSIYVDGRNDNGTLGGTIPAYLKSCTGINFNIGVQNDVLQDFTGYIRLAYVYNRALSQAEITQLHADPYAMFQPSRRYWEYSEASGVVIPIFMYHYQHH